MTATAVGDGAPAVRICPGPAGVYTCNTQPVIVDDDLDIAAAFGDLLKSEGRLQCRSAFDPLSPMTGDPAGTGREGALTGTAPVS